MANKEHLEILKKGIKVWNAWRKTNPGISSQPRSRGLPVKGY